MDSHGGHSSVFLNHYFLHKSPMVDFNSIQQMSRVGMHRRRSEAKNEEEFNAGDEDGEAGFFFRPPGKKMRLSLEQVKHLEKSFAVDNKLVPKRKIQIAKELGLQPRQVAIWFQNRRARLKIKQMERNMDVLRSDFESLRVDYDSLLQERNRLQVQVSALRTLQNIIDGGPLVSLNRRPAPEKPVAEALLPCKQEEASSAKSDVFHFESPEGNYSPAMGPESLEAVFEGGAGLPEGQASYWPWFY